MPIADLLPSFGATPSRTPFGSAPTTPSSTSRTISSNMNFTPAGAFGVPVKHHSVYSCLDGSSSLSHIAYGLSDVALLYPLASGSQIGKSMVQASEEQITNCYGEVTQVKELDTKAGCGTALAGAISTGSIASVCASSQSLVQMLPVMHSLAMQRASAVFHVGVCGLDQQLNMTADYTDVFSAVHTGFAMVHSQSVQECHDLALVCHLASARVNLPFLHFFDQNRTATELAKAQLIPYHKLSKLAERLQDREVRTSDRVPKGRIADAIDDVMAQLRRLLKRRYRLFEYSGSASADHVVVSLCSQSETAALELAVAKACKRGQRVGLLKVRLLRPWSARHFAQVLPLGSLKRVAVVVGATQSRTAANVLFSDVVSSLPQGQGIRTFTTEFASAVTASSAADLFNTLAAPSADVSSHLTFKAAAAPEATDFAAAPSLPGRVKKAIVWDMDTYEKNDTLSANTLQLARLVGESTSFHVQAHQVHDAYNVGGRAASTHMHISPVAFSAPGDGDLALADYLCINDTGVLDCFDVTAQLKDGGAVLINTPAKTNDELESSLPAAFRKDLCARKIRTFVLNTESLDSQLAVQVGLLLLPDLVGEKSLADAAEFVKSNLGIHLAYAGNTDIQSVFDIVDATATGMTLIEVPDAWIAEVMAPPAPAEGDKAESEVSVRVLPTSISKPSFIRAAKDNAYSPPSSAATVQPWHRTAMQVMFPDAYQVEDAHRPGEKEKTFLVKVDRNIRLTPSDYERNVFHLELCTEGTGLTYEIGDALGIFAHNRQCDVDEFLEWYGLNAHDTVVFKDKSGKLETRTVRHVVTQELDLFGRPSRRFYSALAEYAKDPKQAEKLNWLSGPEGGAEFKKRVEATVTFADILQEFGSAHPTMSQLCELIPHIKPRHYSIASSMKMRPNHVDLLIVLVSWTNPDGKERFGQCTKYLVDLKEGAEVTVCVKPSVMTLPEDPMAPVVMAGLGTGMAPFRAFIQERAWQAEQGIKVGPMSLYFGSRSQFEEYLYGDELEAYNVSGLLTNLRCAFSRDGPKKVYIQHKIQEDGKQLHEYLMETNGHFYLCGPTWPAGDVQDAIEAAFVKYGKLSTEDASKLVAELKEHERYILEVY